MNKNAVKGWLGVLVACGFSANAHAGFDVQGNTLMFDDQDWYQVQTPGTFITICNGASSCTVASGTYIIINHTTGERWESVSVPPEDEVDAGEGGDMPDMPGGSMDGALDIVGNELTFATDEWYQVQASDTYQTVCEGVSSCTLAVGTYIVINHATGMRWEDVVISAASGGMPDEGGSDPTGTDGEGPAITMPMFDGSSLNLPDDGWYQVQNTADYVTVCEGVLSCDLADGTYIIINHSTGERWEEFVISTADSGPDTDPGTGDGGSDMPDPVEDGAGGDPVSITPAPVVEGDMLVMAGDGWYEVQTANNYVAVCVGQLTCQVGRGVYNVINHDTGERWDNINVYSVAGVWFGTTSYGEGELIVEPDGTLYGLSLRDDGLVETVFGSVDGTVERYLHLPSRNPTFTDSFNLLGSRPRTFNSFDMDQVNYSLAVGSEGQQVTNSGIAGNFSLALATSDDVAEINLSMVSGRWESKAAYCLLGCNISVMFDFSESGFVTGSTQLNMQGPSELAGSLAATVSSGQYLKIDFLLNGERRSGVVYHDRFSDGLVINAVGVGDDPAESFSAILQRP